MNTKKELEKDSVYAEDGLVPYPIAHKGFVIQKKHIFFNLFWLFSGNALAAICFFVAMVQAARILGPEGFGIVAFAEIVFMFFWNLSNMGLTFLGARNVARSIHDRTNFYVNRVLSLRLLLSFFSLSVLAVFLFLLHEPFFVKSITFVYGLALIPAALFLDWYFQGLEKMAFVALAVFLRAFLFMIGVFFFVRENQQLLIFTLIFNISWLCSTFSLFILYRNRFGSLAIVWDKKFFRKTLRDTAPLGLSLLMAWVIHYFDSMLLFLWKGGSAAGLYNAAYRPIILMITALTVYFNALLPIMSKAAHESSRAMKVVIYWTILTGFFLFFPIAVLGAYWATPLMILIYGQAFTLSGPVFAVLIWWPLLMLLALVYSRCLLCYDQQGLIGKIAVMTALANVVLNLILVPFLSIKGAAFAKVAADILTFFFYFYSTKNFFPFRLQKVLKTLGFLVLGMLFLLFFPWKWHCYPLVVAGLLLYSIIILCLHGIVFKKYLL